MREAGVSLVTVGIFSWAHLEPRAGRLRLRLARRRPRRPGTRPASASTSPPPRRRPRRGSSRRAPGVAAGRPRGRTALARARARRTARPRPAWRERALALVERLADALRRPPRAAHVARRQRVRLPHLALLLRRVRRARSARWLAERYGDVDGVNDAWGTAFWSQRYASTRRDAPAAAHPGRRVGQPDAAAGLPALRLRPAARGVPSPSATCCTGSRPASRSPRTSW